MKKIGILLDCLMLPAEDGIRFAVETGVEGIQFYAAPHHMAFRQRSREDILRIASLAKGSGLEVSALCGDLGGHGFERDDENLEKIPRFRRIIEIASEIEVPVITTHIGTVPRHRGETRSVMQQALKNLSSCARTYGIQLAVETGPEPSEVLRDFIMEVDEPALKVNLDPANFRMVQDEDPAHAVEVLSNLIVHTHAKDGICHRRCDAKVIYDAFAENNPNRIDFDSYFTETPLGDGDVDFTKYLEALDTIGYDGYLTIEREAGTTREDDMKEGVSFLRSCL